LPQNLWAPCNFYNATKGLIAASFPSPIPGTFNKSSALPNGPFFVRNETIAFAVDGPTLGNASNSRAVAVLILTSALFIVDSVAPGVDATLVDDGELDAGGFLCTATVV
jgi:hypothetical protein